MGQSGERLLYPPAVAVCPRCIEVSLQSIVFHSGLDCAHGRSLISRVPGVWCLTVQQAETPAVLLASDTAILMDLGCVQIEAVKASLRLKSSAPPIWVKYRLDAHDPFPAIGAPQPSL
jgi:hypothetical protein